VAGAGLVRDLPRERRACPSDSGRPAEAFDALVGRLESVPLEGPAPAARVDGAIVIGAARVGMSTMHRGRC